MVLYASLLSCSVFLSWMTRRLPTSQLSPCSFLVFSFSVLKDRGKKMVLRVQDNTRKYNNDVDKLRVWRLLTLIGRAILDSNSIEADVSSYV
jgi:hypothetical protein